jgi:hypothetical protein
MAVAQNNGRTTRMGGITGSGFLPGHSGNPGGRPKGLSRRVRELIGDDGEAIAEFMLSVMNDQKARTADRLEAGRWLADRGFGRSVQALDVDVRPHPAIDVTELSDEHLEALLAILGNYSPDVRELAASDEIEIGSSAVPAGSGAIEPRRR